MSRLDRHINVIRTRLFIESFVWKLAWALFILTCVVLVAVAIERKRYSFLGTIGGADVWFWSLLAVAVLVPLAWAIYRRPTAQQAAVFIDNGLDLKEKFSTAVYLRSSDDPFARAAVRDAEVTADNVSLSRRFPIRKPVKHGTAMLVMSVATVLVVRYMDYAPNAAAQAAAKPTAVALTPEGRQAQQLLKDAIKAIDQAPPELARSEKLQAARLEMAQQLAMPSKSAEQQKRTALSTMQELDDLKQKIRDQQKFAQKQEQFARMQKINNVQLSDNSPMSGLKDALAKGDMSSSAAEVEKVTKKFDDMKKEEQKKAADDMQKLADNLQQQTQQPQQQMQQLSQQLQQMGANQQQVQNLANLMQQAAAGNPQAQQQVQQAANQIAQQINNNPNLTPQQQKALTNQVNQIAQQMQGAANNQQQAQAMANAAQQLAQAMQQQANNQQGQQGQQGQQQGQQGGQQVNSGQQQGGQQGQAGQQQAQAGQGAQQGQQGNQGQQQGGQGQQPGQGQAQQGVADAGQALADQLQQQVGGDQPGQGQQPSELTDGTMPGDQGGDQGGGQTPQPGEQAGGDQQGQFQPGEQANHQGGNGAGGPGQGIGGRPKGAATPYTVKQEQSPTFNNKDGELIASQFIKAINEKGKSTAEAQKVIETAEKESADEVEQDRISRQGASIVKKYFDDLKNDANKK